MRLLIAFAIMLALIGTASAAHIWLYGNNGFAFGSANRTPPPPSGDIFVPAGII